MAALSSKESVNLLVYEIVSNEGGDAYSILGGSPRVEYRESVFLPYYSISSGLIDSGFTGTATDGTGRTINIVDIMKLQGTEAVRFHMSDSRGNEIKVLDDDKLRLNVNESQVQGSKSLSLALNSISKEGFDDCLLDNRCRTSYAGKISDIVVQILRQNLKYSGDIYVDLTKKDYQEFGLDRTPFDFIRKLQRLAVPNMSKKTAGYLFWRTYKGFHFKSIDNLFDTKGKTIKKYKQTDTADRSIEFGFDDRILYSSIKRTSDALTQLRSGTWGTKLEYYDDAEKVYEKPEELTSTGKGFGIIAGKQLTKLNDEYGGKATVRIVANAAKGQLSLPGDNLDTQVEKTGETSYNVEEVLQQSKQRYRQIFNMSCEIVIPVDLSLHAGDLVEIDLPEISNKTNPQKSATNSGIYMIADLCHFSNSTKAFTGLHLVRDSLGVK